MSAIHTTVLLVRHGQTDAVGQWLAGRTEGVGLNQAGRAQAERLRARLSSLNLAAIYSSPLQRAVETAGPLAHERGLRVEPRLELAEVDFGEWNGQRFDTLAADPRWTRFNTHRSLAAVPRGERAPDVQARIVRTLDDLRSAHPGQIVVCVSHADVIRLAVLSVAGAPIDFIHRFEITPASVTAVALHDTTAVLLYVNERDPMTNGI
jgi:probable phosphomutase (TIGR03848 family)